MEEQEKICAVCGGSGQLSFFQGVSRFLLSTEECSVCAGTGRQQDDAGGKARKDRAPKRKKRGRQKK